MAQGIPSTPADANVSVMVLTAMAGDAPTVAEITAGVDISCYLTADGFNFAQEQATISDDRLCSNETFALPGRKSFTLTLTGIDNTNSPLEDQYNEFVETLAEGSQRYIVYRWGIPYEDAYATGQTVRVIPIRVGAKTELPPEANSVLRSTVNTFVSGPSELVTVAA